LDSEDLEATGLIPDGAGATSNPFLQRERAGHAVEPTTRDGVHDRGGKAADGGRLVHVVPVSRAARGERHRPARAAVVLRAGARACIDWIRARAGSRRVVRVAVGRVLPGLLVVTIAVSALSERDSAQGAHDDALQHLATAERAAAQLNDANRVLRRQRDRLAAVAREAERRHSRAAAAARRWRRLATRRPGHADRKRRTRR
jgi:hypothetical protein